MKNASWLGLLAAAVMAVGTIGCAESPAAPPDADAELVALKERANNLAAAAQIEGTITPEIRSAVARLSADIKAWNAQTGRTDISVSEGVRRTDEAKPRTAPRQSGGSMYCCEKYFVDGWRMCFLVTTECQYWPEGQFLGPPCGYTCITIWPGK